MSDVALIAHVIMGAAIALMAILILLELRKKSSRHGAPRYRFVPARSWRIHAVGYTTRRWLQARLLHPCKNRTRIYRVVLHC